MTRYMRVIKTFHECFLARHYPDVDRLRQLRPLHIEEYKRLTSGGRDRRRANDS